MTQTKRVETAMSVRAAIDQILTIAGVIVIVVTVTLLTESWTPLFIVLGGALMIGAGAWRLGKLWLGGRGGDAAASPRRR